MSKEKQYADRDIMHLDEVGNYYFRHVDAMTGEKLHSKSEIAAELGYRDMQIDAYRNLCGELLSSMYVVKSSFNNAPCQPTLEDLVNNINSVITKAEKLLGEK